LDKISATRHTRIVRVHSFEPSGRLRPYVRAVRVIVTGAEVLTAPLPEPGMVLGLRYAGHAVMLEQDGVREIPDATLSGIRPSVRRIHTSGGGGLVVVVFEATGAAHFFGGPLHELFSGMADLAELTSRAATDRLQTRLAEARTDAARAGLVDAYLCSLLVEHAGDPIVTAAAAAIRRARGRLRVEALGLRLGLSTDRLEKRFRRSVGASPKQLASIVRFRHAVRAYRPGLTLTQLAYDAGYFDQSHLVRDFRAVTGQAPGAFLRSPFYWAGAP
jgi:AraC-like DNA-binding protein